MTWLDEIARIARGEGAAPVAHPQDASQGNVNVVPGGGATSQKGIIKLNSLVIPLDTAIPNTKNNGEYRIPGSVLWIDAASTGVAYINLSRTGTPTAPGISAVPGTVLKTSLDYIYVSAVAQPNALLIIQWGDFDVVPSILQGGLTASLSWSLSAQNFSAAVATGTAIQVVDPAVNKNGLSLVAGSIRAQGAGALQVSMVARATAPASFSDGAIITRDEITAAGVCRADIINPLKVPIGLGIWTFNLGVAASLDTYLLYSIL